MQLAIAAENEQQSATKQNFCARVTLSRGRSLGLVCWARCNKIVPHQAARTHSSDNVVQHSTYRKPSADDDNVRDSMRGATICELMIN